MNRFEMRQLAEEYDGFVDPSAEILVDGSILKGEDGLWLEQIKITSSVFHEPDSAMLHYLVRTPECVKKMENLLCAGSRIEIKTGYGKSVMRVFYGYIHEISVRAGTGDIIGYTILCMDVKGLMRLNSVYGISGVKRTDRILSEILNDGMYAPFIESRKVEKLPGCMNGGCFIRGDTHYDWLCGLADFLHFSFSANNGRLYFGPAGKDGDIVTELAAGCGVGRIETCVTLSGQTGSVEVSGFNGKDEKLSALERWKAPGGPFERKLPGLLSHSSRVYSAFSISTDEQAAYRARALMRRMEEDCSKMEIEAAGIPQMQPGIFIKVKTDAINSLSGKIYVEEVTHSLGADGYSMVVKGRR